MTARSGIDYDFPHSRLTVAKAQLNPPFFVPSDNISAVMLKNHGDTPLWLKNVAFNCEGFVEGSAVMYSSGEKIPLKVTATEDKITVTGIYIPPRENVIVFYRTKAEG